MIEKFYPGGFERNPDFTHSGCVCADQPIERLHAPNGSNRNTGSLGELDLLPSDEGAGRAKLASGAEARLAWMGRQDRVWLGGACRG